MATVSPVEILGRCHGCRTIALLSETILPDWTTRFGCQVDIYVHALEDAVLAWISSA